MIVQLQPAGLGVYRRGMGDTFDFSALSAIDTSTITGFLTQQVGPLPMWAWAGGAVMALWWLTWPSGSDYRKRRRALRAEYSGVGKIRRRAGRVSKGVSVATS